MDKKEAIQAMLDGKKVKIAFWSNDVHMFYMDETFCIQDINGNIHPVSINQKPADGWMFYEEKKALYQWLIRSGNDYYRTSHYYATKQEAQDAFTVSQNVIRRLDETKIEI